MKAIIIEDEPLAIDNLKFFLKDYPIEIIGTAYKIKEAVKLIKKGKPEVVFLDINLSGENGFDLLEKIEIDFKLVFVTAYDEYAIRAFEVNALDYLLKPLNKERIKKTISRLLGNVPRETIPKKYTIDDSILLSIGNRANFIKLKNIYYLEADSCYSKIVLSKKDIRISTHTLKRWEEMLPQQDFIRIHRSYLLNLNHVKEIKKRNNGTYLVYFKGLEDSIEISRRYGVTLKNRLNI